MKSDPRTTDPSKLLEAFLGYDRRERAFTALVGSSNRLVYSVALRRTGHDTQRQTASAERKHAGKNAESSDAKLGR